MILVTIGIISSKQSYRTEVGMESRPQDFFGHFLEYSFYKVFSYKLKPCRDCARELNRVSGNWCVRDTAASDLFNLMYKECIKRVWKRLRGNN